jgi:hypothetical protein
MELWSEEAGGCPIAARQTRYLTSAMFGASSDALKSLISRETGLSVASASMTSSLEKTRKRLAKSSCRLELG